MEADHEREFLRELFNGDVEQAVRFNETVWQVHRRFYYLMLCKGQMSINASRHDMITKYNGRGLGE